MTHRALLVLLLLVLVPLAGAQAQPVITDTPLPTATSFIYTTTPIPIAPSPTRPPTRTPIPPTFTPTITLTPSPTAAITGSLLGAQAESLFPFGIRLRVDLMGEASLLSDVQLTLNVPGRPPIVLSPTMEELTPDPVIRAIEYVWLAPEDDPPAVFSIITYQWTLAFTDGTTAEASGQVMYSEPDTYWVFNSGAGGRLVLASMNRPRPALMRALNPVYERLSGISSRQVTARYLLFDEALAPECPLANSTALDITRCMPGTTAAAYQGGGYKAMRDAPGLETEITRDLIGTMLGRQWALGDVPAWWKEALARWYAPQPMSEALQTSRDALRAGLQFSLAEMRERPADPAAQLRWDAQAYGMLMLLFSRHGADTIDAAAAEAGASPLEDVLQQRFASTQAGLIDAWQRWVFTSEAVQAYRFTPYLPATATATPTRTVTLTATASDTPAPTLTPSASFTRRPVTVTRTPLAQAVLPTNTPRSMVYPDATTSEPTDGALADPARVLAFVALLLLIVALLAVFVLTGRRPKAPQTPSAAPLPAAPESEPQAKEPAKPND